MLILTLPTTPVGRVSLTHTRRTYASLLVYINQTTRQDKQETDFPRDPAEVDLSVLNHPGQARSGFDNKIADKCPMVIDYSAATHTHTHIPFV